MVLNQWKKIGRNFPQLMLGWNNLRQPCAHTLQVSKNDLFKGTFNRIGEEKKKVEGIKAGVKADSVDLQMRRLDDLLRDTVHTYQQWQQGKVSITSKGFYVLQKRLYAITTNTLAQAVPSIKVHLPQQSIENKRGIKRSFAEINETGSLTLHHLFEAKSLLIEDAERWRAL